MTTGNKPLTEMPATRRQWIFFSWAFEHKVAAFIESRKLLKSQRFQSRDSTDNDAFIKFTRSETHMRFETFTTVDG